jgi:signal transduction histidine kinase
MPTTWRTRDDVGVSATGIASMSHLRRLPALVSFVLVAIGVLATAVRLDAASDGTTLDLGWSTWRTNGVVVDVPAPSSGQLQPGDLVTAVAGRRLADGVGGVAQPAAGEVVPYAIIREDFQTVDVVMQRPDPLPLLSKGWGNLVFVVALGLLAVALYLRRPDEPAVRPLLVLAAGLFGSTLAVVAGLPALALSTAGPQLWLFHLSTIGVYSAAWGAALALSLTFIPGHPWLRRKSRGIAYAAPLALMAVWTTIAALRTDDTLRFIGLVHAGQTAVVAATLLFSIVSGIVAYRSANDALSRSRLRWLASGSVATALLGLTGWQLPELLTGRHPLPPGSVGLSALPFVAGIGVALRRHRLFDIERLANRSVVYAATVAILVAAYAVVVSTLVSGLRLSGTVAAALAAAGSALALAPLRNAAQTAVNRIMYGDRNEPAAALARLGRRLGGVLLPADVLPAVVATVARSLRVPFAAIELADGAGGYRAGAAHGEAIGAVHSEPVPYQGSVVGRLSVSARGLDDPLDQVDLALIGALAQQVGPAVEAVRLNGDLVRSRADVVASREDERRRLRRDLHDGLGPTLAAIGLKAGLAAREIAAGSSAHGLLGEIAAEAKASLADVRRLVDALRPPALDELGLVGAVLSRAVALAGDLSIEVSGPNEPEALPAAVETAAFRIAVEAMTNAARHSGGRHCSVLIAWSGTAVEVTVRDDGHGLDPARAAGVGLRSMYERAAEVGGACSVTSPAGAGTEVHAVLPTGGGSSHDHVVAR